MPAKDKPSSQKTKWKWRFRMIALLGSLVVAEVLACLGLKLFGPVDTTLATLHQLQHSVATGVGHSDGSTEVIHPYLGWVHNPQTAPSETIFGVEVSVNALGFQDNDSAIHKRSRDTILVGIFGGSVAWQTGIVGAPLIREILESDPLLAGKTVKVVLLAKSGHKQPQQLLAYNYLTSLGAEFDAVVNIDGYNEVALSVCDNFYHGTSLAYPRAWHSRAIQLVDPRTSADAYRLLKLRAHRQGMARRMDHSLLKWSWTANLAWFLRNLRADSKVHELAMQVHRNHASNFIYHGPPDNFANEEAMRKAVVDLWFRSSLQFHASCQPSDTIYIHVLQPNQYHEGSKPMMRTEEKDVAFSESEISHKPIHEIYPLIVDAGKELRQRGVQFSDQTLLFADIEEPIYVDCWCHYNQKGNSLLAEQVAQQLLLALKKKPSGKDELSQ